MAFKTIVDWFSGKNHRKHNAKLGALTVTHEGDAIVVVHFAPDFVVVNFTEQDPPVDSCSQTPCDELDTTIMDLSTMLGQNRWGIKISWKVAGIRHIHYEIKAY